MSDLPAEKSDKERKVLLVAPLIILAFALGVVAVLLESSRGQPQAPETAAVAPSTQTPPPTPPPATTARPTIAPAIPWGILPANQPRATETAVPTPVAAEPVLLLGPPADSVFSAGSAINFYWQWSAELEDGQTFVVQAGADGRWREIGRLDGVNMGQLYRLTVDTAEAGLDAGSYQWQVVLESGGGESSQTVSPARPLRIVG